MIQFLPKYRTPTSKDDAVYQSVFIPDYTGAAACNICYYKSKQSPQGTLTWIECAEKYKCDFRNQPYIAMELLNQAEVDEAEDPSDPDQLCYEKTTFVRQAKVKSMPRYCQFVTSRLTGYPCNSLCQFFLERVAKRQSALSCGKAKGCANNSSFYNLLVPADPTLRAIYDQQMLDDSEP